MEASSWNTPNLKYCSALSNASLTCFSSFVSSGEFLKVSISFKAVLIFSYASAWQCVVLLSPRSILSSSNNRRMHFSSRFRISFLISFLSYSCTAICLPPAFFWPHMIFLWCIHRQSGSSHTSSCVLSSRYFWFYHGFYLINYYYTQLLHFGNTNELPTFAN